MENISTRWRSPGTSGVKTRDSEFAPFPGGTSHRRPGLWASGPGLGEVQTAPAGQQLAAPVRAPEPALPSAAARTPRARPDASLLAPPAQAAAPAGHRMRPAALRPQTRSGFRSPPSRHGRVLGSTPSPARLPRRFAQNIPSICPLPGILLLGPGPARLKSFPPDPLLGRSSRNSGLACHGSYQLLSSPT